MERVVKAGIVQAAPVPLAMQAAIDHAVALAKQALETGLDVVAFGETFLGGYPMWVDAAPGAALWDHPGTRELHALLLNQAIRGNDPRLKPLQKLSDKSGALISIGGHERVRSSLYNTQYLFRPKAPPLIHRKLVPTHGERMIWGRGDGSTLGVHQADWGNVGQLICWEHWMPLARAAMHHQGETIHIAAWPTVRDLYLLASCHYAFEGRCFVLAAGTVQDKQELLDGLEMAGGNGHGRVVRDDPVALSPRAFVNSWLVAPWSASSRWLVPGLAPSASARWWKRLHGEPTLGEFEPTTLCRDGRHWQVGVSTGDEGKPTVTAWFVIAWQPPYRFRVAAISPKPRADCRIADPEAERYRTLFPQGDWIGF